MIAVPQPRRALHMLLRALHRLQRQSCSRGLEGAVRIRQTGPCPLRHLSWCAAGQRRAKKGNEDVNYKTCQQFESAASLVHLRLQPKVAARVDGRK